MTTIPRHGVDFKTIKKGHYREFLKMKANAAEMRFLGTYHLWPEVTNPIARDVVRTAYFMLPEGTFYGPAFDDPEKATIEVHDYQMWLTIRLDRSGLDKGLAGGPALLPDATADLPWPWQYLARRYGPKNIRQLTRHVTRNLDWFVDQAQKLRDPWTVAAELMPMTLTLTTMLMLTLAVTTPLYKVHWVILTGLVLLATGVIFTAQCAWGQETHKHKTNCAEMYHYLVRMYSDVPENPGENPEKWRLKLSRKYML